MARKLIFLWTTYFEGLGENTDLACSLLVEGMHIDLVEAPGQLDEIQTLSLGLIDGRNIWKTDLQIAAEVIQQVEEKIGSDRLWIAPSCSLLHCPVDLDMETDEATLPGQVKRWMAFANQQLEELTLLKKLADDSLTPRVQKRVNKHQSDLADKRESVMVHNPGVQQHR